MRRIGPKERLLAQATLDHFRMHGEWPTFGVLERQHRSQMDVEEVYHRLFSHRDHFGTVSRETQVQLDPPLILQLTGYDEAYQLLVEALPMIEESYFASEAGKIHHSDFLARGWSPEQTQRLGLLLRDQVPFRGSAGWNPDSWYCEIKPNIQRYARCHTPRDYLRLRAHEARKWHRRHRWDRMRRAMSLRRHEPNRWVWSLLVPLLVTVAGGLAVWWLTR